MPVLSARFSPSQGLSPLLRAAAEHARNPLLVVSGLSSVGAIERCQAILGRAIPGVPVLCVAQGGEHTYDDDALLLLIDDGAFSVIHCPARGDLSAQPAIEALRHFLGSPGVAPWRSFLVLSGLPVAKSEALREGVALHSPQAQVSVLYGGCDAWISQGHQAARGGFLLVAFEQPLDLPGSIGRTQSHDITSFEDHHVFYRTVIEEMDAGLCLLDPRGVLLYESPSSQKLHGQAPLEMVGKDWIAACVHPDDQQPMRDVLYGLLGAENAVSALEIRLRCTRQTWCSVQVSLRNCLHMPEIRALLCTFKDISALKDVEHQLRLLATTDILTGLPNRRHFDTLARQEIARTLRYQRPLTLVMIDVDYFKSINDRFGHPVGDEVLRCLGDICRQELRCEEMPSRLGGEEFAVLLPETDLAGARLLAERLRRAVSTYEIPALKDHALTASFGISQFTGSEDTLESMMARADEALYTAKRNGRNRVEVAALATACVA